MKYEEVKQVDYINSTKSKKKFKIVKQRRDLFTENSEYIFFPRGILELIPSSEYIIEENVDNLSKIQLPDLSDDNIRKSLTVFDLRDDQVLAVKKSLICKRGVIQLPTATGKSAIITSTIKQLLSKNSWMKFLVIAPTLSTVKNIADTLKKNGIKVSIYGHPDKKIKDSVTVSLAQSLISSEDKELLYGISAVFYDECLPANSRILLSDGSFVPISEVFDNDSITSVLSYNTETLEYEPKKIIRKYKTPFNDRFCKVYYEDTVHKTVSGLTCTQNHKIYVKGKGYVPAEDLVKGDLIKIDYPYMRGWRVLEDKTYMEVTKVTFNVGKVAEYKYNLEIEDNHNYFANSVLVSNCHHLKCETWNKLNSMIPNAEYSLGFSALSIDKSEIFNTDIRDFSYESSLIVGSAGRVLMHMDPSYYIEKGIIALPVVFRIKNNVVLPKGFDESDWNKLTKVGLMSIDRTQKVAKVASLFSKHNRKTLILVSEKEYAFTLGKYLVSCGCTSFGISFGAGTGYVYKNYFISDEGIEVEYSEINSMDVIDCLTDGDINIVIATTHLDEGVDISNLDVCILANGGIKDRRIIQRVGRVLRKSKSGKYAYIIDFTDNGSFILKRHSKSRLEMFKSEIGVPPNNIYNEVSIDEIEKKFLELEN